ncbi:DUF4153 domain-containing protein [Campylobacter geochelonis]|uniref:DUF4153 domain-containing protein n=1 Tax=Campylobacter geochelonis TaxID=1780362 RepID=UPI000770938C|nr:DUF4153 domain-containing protein [Campylobacter geochelonis]CZE51269.1 N-carbamoyl-L-amino acid amidohydrolase [Campylobacter geochelonis]
MNNYKTTILSHFMSITTAFLFSLFISEMFDYIPKFSFLFSYISPNLSYLMFESKFYMFLFILIPFAMFCEQFFRVKWAVLAFFLYVYFSCYFVFGLLDFWIMLLLFSANFMLYIFAFSRNFVTQDDALNHIALNCVNAAIYLLLFFIIYIILLSSCEYLFSVNITFLYKLSWILIPIFLLYFLKNVRENRAKFILAKIGFIGFYGFICLYMLFLYIYILLYAFGDEKSGVINLMMWFVLFATAFFITNHTAAYKKWLQAAFLPIILFCFYAIILRVNEYGWSVNRVYVFACCSSLFITNLYALGAKFRLSRVFLFSAFIIYILTISPFSAKNIAIKSQTNVFLANYKTNIKKANEAYDYLKKLNAKLSEKIEQEHKILQNALKKQEPIEYQKYVKYANVTGCKLFIKDIRLDEYKSEVKADKLDIITDNFSIIIADSNSTKTIKKEQIATKFLEKSSEKSVNFKIDGVKFFINYITFDENSTLKSAHFDLCL